MINIWHVYQRLCYVEFNDQLPENSAGARSGPTAATEPDEDVPEAAEDPDEIKVYKKSNLFWNYVDDQIARLHESANEDCETEDEIKAFIQE